jgi:hypothetical protein
LQSERGSNSENYRQIQKGRPIRFGGAEPGDRIYGGVFLSLGESLSATALASASAFGTLLIAVAILGSGSRTPATLGTLGSEFVFGQIAVAVCVERLQRLGGFGDLSGGNCAVAIDVKRSDDRRTAFGTISAAIGRAVRSSVCGESGAKGEQGCKYQFCFHGFVFLRFQFDSRQADCCRHINRPRDC